MLKKPKLRFNFREYLKFEGEHETEIKIRDSSQSFTRFTDLIQRESETPDHKCELLLSIRVSQLRVSIANPIETCLK